MHTVCDMVNDWLNYTRKKDSYSVLARKEYEKKFEEDLKFYSDATIKEMIELQQKYVSSVGRNLQISDKQRETLLATQKLMGENTTEFARKLENIGIGLEKSGDIAAKMFNEATKSGISFEKYSTRKNGVEYLSCVVNRLDKGSD